MEIGSRSRTLSDQLDPPRPISADNQMTTGEAEMLAGWRMGSFPASP
jgi:hypothetical protein